MSAATTDGVRWSRFFRYLAPNLITSTSLVFGMLSLVATHEHRYVDAAWLITYAVLMDRMDGFVARLVRGTSDLGVQLDSFADFLNFGLAPAYLMYVALSTTEGLPLSDGAGYALLIAASISWVFGATFRLARFNITTEDSPTKVFFGVPTTLAAGLLAIWWLALLKYSPDYALGGNGGASELRLFGDGWYIPQGVWRYFPVAMFVGAYMMASNMRMPKLGRMGSKPLTIFVLTNVALGYICGFARLFPEYMVWPPTAWLVIFLVWGYLSPEARAMEPPPVFPDKDGDGAA